MTKQVTPDDLIGICEAEYVDSPEGMHTAWVSWPSILVLLKPFKKIQLKKIPDLQVSQYSIPGSSKGDEMFVFRYRGVKLNHGYEPASDNGSPPVRHTGSTGSIPVAGTTPG